MIPKSILFTTIQVNRRFEQIDRRFEQVDKQFSIMMWAIGIGFSVVVAFMSATAGFFRQNPGEIFTLS